MPHSTPILPSHPPAPGLIVLPWRLEKKLHTSYGSASTHQQNLPAQPSSNPNSSPTAQAPPLRGSELFASGVSKQQSLGHFLAGHVEGLDWMIPGAPSSSRMSGVLVA
ncbi:unnamed protein product [Rangifer tarandus platyrhynchus]|uniref:Uncharacterized protein n=2 Tax=Rangifer tarandus platyrhynchus TaxID=3082113 RepID=A0ABN8YZH7_RANTA|nr:unnamed protein product [Rangifer tarandus platyrhynchus]